MTKKFKVKTVGAIFNNQPLGSTIELSEQLAKKYSGLGYVEIISEVKPKATPKAKAKPKAKTKTEKKVKEQTDDK